MQDNYRDKDFSVQPIGKEEKTVRYAVDGRDKAGTSIRLIAFGEAVCKKFSQIITVYNIIHDSIKHKT